MSSTTLYCPKCKQRYTESFDFHPCNAPPVPVTAEQVRAIVREELQAALRKPWHDGKHGPG